MSGLWCKCHECGEEGACFFRVEEQRICATCIGRAVRIAEDAEMDRRLHDQVWHREPVDGCEQCKVRQ